MSNCLDPDQNCCPVGHDLDPNCLQKLSADQTTKVTVTKERVISAYILTGKRNATIKFCQVRCGSQTQAYYDKHQGYMN